MKKISLLLLLLLMACADGAGSVAKATEIQCMAAYRSSVTVGIEQEVTTTFSEMDETQSLAFGEMVLNGTYRTGEVDGERSLRLWVTTGDETAVLHNALYQLPQASGPQNQFVGGHGFTGLHYSYAPPSEAELQFWCTAS